MQSRSDVVIELHCFQIHCLKLNSWRFIPLVSLYYTLALKIASRTSKTCLQCLCNSRQHFYDTHRGRHWNRNNFPYLSPTELGWVLRWFQGQWDPNLFTISNQPEKATLPLCKTQILCLIALLQTKASTPSSEQAHWVAEGFKIRHLHFGKCFEICRVQRRLLRLPLSLWFVFPLSPWITCYQLQLLCGQEADQECGFQGVIHRNGVCNSRNRIKLWNLD